MKRTIRLVTHDGLIREMSVPSLKLTIRRVEFEDRIVPRFEHVYGTGLGADIAVYEEARIR